MLRYEKLAGKPHVFQQLTGLSLQAFEEFLIVRDLYRNHRSDFDDLVMETACGLQNLRCNYRLSAA